MTSRKSRKACHSPGGVVFCLIVVTAWAGMLWHSAHNAAVNARRVENALANVPSIIIICDGRERPLFVSESVKRETGWTPEEIETFGLGLLIPPDVLPIHNRAYAAEMSSTHGPKYTTRIIEFLKKDGSRGRALAKISVIEHSGRREAYAFILPLDAENYDLAVTFKESEP